LRRGHREGTAEQAAVQTESRDEIPPGGHDASQPSLTEADGFVGYAVTGAVVLVDDALADRTGARERTLAIDVDIATMSPTAVSRVMGSLSAR
jgi:hypothetical protein